jgi:hypothetical protein
MADMVRVEGARELRASLDHASAELGDLSDTHAEVAARWAAAARAAAPVVSGRLRATVRAEHAATAAVVTAGGAGVPYAGPIHWGWPARNIAPSEFITGTAETMAPTWTDTYQSAVGRIVDRIHGK